MVRVQTNKTTLIAARESTPGVLPGSPVWFTVPRTALPSFGQTFSFEASRPITDERGRRKGVIIDSDSPVEFESDLTLEVVRRFSEGLIQAEMVNVEFRLSDPKLVGAAVDVDGTTDAFDLGAALSTFTNGALLEGKLTYALGAAKSLLWSKGYVNAINNGLHELDVDPTTASTTLGVATDLVTETAPANAEVYVCGVRVSDGDLSLSAPSGGQATLTSTADVSDWSTLGIVPGMFIHIGSPDSTGTLQNALSDAVADDTFGYARVRSIASNVLTLDKLGTALDSAANNTSTGEADVMFCQLVRDVLTTADADDNRALELTYQLEAAYPDLQGAGNDGYEYAIGNTPDEIEISAPLGGKATASVGFVGLTSDRFTTTRKTGAASALSDLFRKVFSSAVNLSTLTTDLVAAASDVCFKSLTTAMRSNASPEKCLGTLGAVFVNTGLFEVDVEGQMLFTRGGIIDAIRDNTTVTLLQIFTNEDGAITIDVPSATVNGGGREFPIDQTVLVNLTFVSFTDTFFSHNIGISILPAVPGAVA